jgi:Short C-terminal domain
MGLVRGMARTAVVAGTATAVSNRVSRRQANRWSEQEAQQYQQPAYQEPAPAPPPPPAAPAAPEDDTAEQLQRLANMRAQNLINDEEYAAAKAKLLGI